LRFAATFASIAAAKVGGLFCSLGDVAGLGFVLGVLELFQRTNDLVEFLVEWGQVFSSSF